MWGTSDSTRSLRRRAAVLAALVVGATVASTVPVGAATAPLDPFDRYERTEVRPERATSVEASGMVAWYDPGVGAQVGRAPRASWTRAGVWNLTADTEWELDLPALPGGTVSEPMPLDVDPAGNVVGTVRVAGLGLPAVRPVRWAPDGTPTMLAPPAGGGDTVPTHVTGSIAVGTRTSGLTSLAVRWDAGVVSNLPVAPGTTDCAAQSGDGDVVLGVCWVGSARALVRWNLTASTVTVLPVQPTGGPREVLHVDPSGRMAVTVGDDRNVDDRNPNGSIVHTIQPTWSTFDDRSDQLAIGDATIMGGGDVLATAGWWYGDCPCQAAVVGIDSAVRWIDPDPVNGETSMEGIGALTDGTVVAVASATQVLDAYGPYVQQRGTAFYAPDARTPFPDVLPGHPFFNEIERAHELGYARGYDDGTFRPGATVTRQAFVAFQVRARTDRWGFPPPPACVVAPFPDVAVSHPFCPEIAQAKARGWVTGYDDGMFRPGWPITRQAVVAVMFRTNPSVSAPLPTECRLIFPDVGLDHPFCAAITWAFDADVINGFPDGTFRPGIDSSRQATVAILERSLAAGDLAVASGWYAGP